MKHVFKQQKKSWTLNINSTIAQLFDPLFLIFFLFDFVSHLHRHLWTSDRMCELTRSKAEKKMCRKKKRNKNNRKANGAS